MSHPNGSSSAPTSGSLPQSTPESNPPSTSPLPSDPANPASLPPAAIALASRMFDAARNGDPEGILAQGLTAGLPRNMRNEKGDSLIMLSSYHGHSALVSLLLSYKADPNVLNDRQQSPLAGAVFKNEEEVVKVLLRGGADPDIGEPSAQEAVRIFGQGSKWDGEFEEVRKRLGSGRETGAVAGE